jgi:hypothetical protein
LIAPPFLIGMKNEKFVTHVPHPYEKPDVICNQTVIFDVAAVVMEQLIKLIAHYPYMQY